MNWKNTIYMIILAVLIVSVSSGCKATGESVTSGRQDTRPSGWTDETHGNNADPDHEIVFPRDKVNQIKSVSRPMPERMS